MVDVADGANVDVGFVPVEFFLGHFPITSCLTSLSIFSLAKNRTILFRQFFGDVIDSKISGILHPVSSLIREGPDT
jgi:hypothetical protein